MVACVYLAFPETRCAASPPTPAGQTDRNSDEPHVGLWLSPYSRCPRFAQSVHIITPLLPGGACAHIFCCLAPATTGLHGVVLLMDMDQWTTHVRKANGHGPHRLHSLRTWVDGMDERWKLDRLCLEAAVVRWQPNRRPLPCPQEPSKSRRTWSEMTTPYGFVEAVAEQVRLRCMGSSTPHGYEVAFCPR